MPQQAPGVVSGGVPQSLGGPVGTPGTTTIYTPDPYILSLLGFGPPSPGQITSRQAKTSGAVPASAKTGPMPAYGTRRVEGQIVFAHHLPIGVTLLMFQWCSGGLYGIESLDQLMVSSGAILGNGTDTQSEASPVLKVETK